MNSDHDANRLAIDCLHQMPAVTAGTDPRQLALEEVEGLAGQLAPEARLVVERLAALLEEDEADEYGVLRPTLSAFRSAFDLLYGAALQLREHFPRAAVSTDSEGGCRIQWNRPERQVRLVIPASASGTTYIYHQAGSEYASEEEVNVEKLVNWLDWLRRAP